jgi:hypothetical protein
MKDALRSILNATSSAGTWLWRCLEAAYADGPPAMSVCAWPFMAYRSTPGLQWRSKIGQSEEARGDEARGNEVLTRSVREADLRELVVLGKVPGELSPRPQAAFAQHRAEMVLDGSGADK